MQKCDKQNILLQGLQRKKMETRSYTVDKIKHVVNKKLHGWQNKTCCKH